MGCGDGGGSCAEAGGVADTGFHEQKGPKYSHHMHPSPYSACILEKKSSLEPAMSCHDSSGSSYITFSHGGLFASRRRKFLKRAMSSTSKIHPVVNGLDRASRRSEVARNIFAPHCVS